MIAVDFEYNKHGKLLMFQWFTEGKEHYILNPTKEQILSVIDGKTIVGYNLLNDFKIVGFTPQELERFKYHDLLLASFIKFYDNWEQQLGWGLDKILQRIGYTIENKKQYQKAFAEISDASLITPDMIEYALSDVRYLVDLYRYFEKTGVLADKVYKLDIQMIPVTLDMMYRGLPFDVAGAINEKIAIQVEQEEIVKTLHERLGKVNLNSPAQLVKALGLPSTDKKTLMQEVINGNENAKLLLQYRNKTKRIQFLDKYIQLTQRTGRLYGNFSITFAPSGRMTCRDENLQQIPRDIKHLFKVQNGYLVKIDFPAIELRLATILQAEPTMLKLFKEGADLHTYTAKHIYSKDEISKEERQIAKSLNFGLLYGMSAKGLKEYLETNLQKPFDLQDCIQFRYNWFSLYPGYKQWHNTVSRILEKAGYYEGETIYGRKYFTRQLTKALNIQVQGSGAELLKITAVRAYKRGVRFINLVHDELLMEADSIEQAEEYVKIVCEEATAVWEKFCIAAVGEVIPLPLEPVIKQQWGE